MDSISVELHIPRRQLREVKSTCNNRFEAIVAKQWLKTLVSKGRVLSNVPELKKDLFEWPSNGKGLDHNWQKVHITVSSSRVAEVLMMMSSSYLLAFLPLVLQVYQKRSYKVLPLPKSRESEKKNNLPLIFSQLMNQVGEANNRSIWKAAYYRFPGARTPYQQYQEAQRAQNEIASTKLPTHEAALREVILRAYKCRIVQKYGQGDLIEPKGDEEAHLNLSPGAAVVETSGHFFVIHDDCIENTLLDCVTFSPAILNNFNKPLFLIYQLLNLIKCFHERGLVLGEINLFDIHLTENLWLQVFPNLEANLVDPKDFLIPPIFPKMELPKELGTDYRIDEYCEMWHNGFLSNYDYLMVLNRLAGRTMDSHAHHPVMPWVS